MSSSAYESGWQWPENIPGRWAHDENGQTEGLRPQSMRDETRAAPSTPHQPNAGQSSQQEEPKFHRPRTCRICLEVVQPTYEPPSENLPEMLRGKPSVSYKSEDGGRLMRPCRCKGSQKYVHEECLSAWRLQDPLNKRNYWQCPTCRYNYRLERLTLARYIGSTAAQIFLTISIFLLTTFTIGYVADPIINLYLDPYDTIVAVPSGQSIYVGETDTWAEHFLKGFAGLGLLGFAKFLLTLSPWNLWNMRHVGGGRAATGRDRMQQISWIAVTVGIVTFLWAVWKGVRAWSRRTLEKASERVIDVPSPLDDDEE